MKVKGFYPPSLPNRKLPTPAPCIVNLLEGPPPGLTTKRTQSLEIVYLHHCISYLIEGHGSGCKGHCMQASSTVSSLSCTKGSAAFAAEVAPAFA